MTRRPQQVPRYEAPEPSPRPSGLLVAENLDPLAKKAGEGDPGAIQELLRLLGPMVVRYCRARLGRRDRSFLSADDVAQEVCMAILKALPGYQDRGGSFLYLVYAIAANKVADAYRAASRERCHPVDELPDVVSGEATPDTTLLQRDLGDRLGRMMATLPRIQQEILALRIAVGLSATETAEALGISAGNVRVTQHRALARLRTMVSQDEMW
ncbi:RNA polymerase sigma factor ShbA [Amycolatopsis japonica]